MKKFLLLTVIVGMAPLSMFAQNDDMYFVPNKADKEARKAAAEAARTYTPPPPRYLDMSVDEYNRRHLSSSYEKIGTDSVGNDIIEFSAGDGTYPTTPDTVYVYKYDDSDDFRYSSRMGIFDDFYGWYDPFLYGYRGSFWGGLYYPYYGPWFRSRYYDPFFAGWYGWYDWYDPWYYSYYRWGWDPWYYSSYGWYSPFYWGRRFVGTYAYNGNTQHHGVTRYSALSAGNAVHHKGYTTTSRGTFGGRGVARGNYGSSSSRSSRTYSSSSTRSGFGGSRAGTYSSGSSGTRSYSSGSSGGSRSSGGSFGGGGSRSGGGFSGGGRGGGGGGSRSHR